MTIQSKSRDARCVLCSGQVWAWLGGAAACQACARFPEHHKAPSGSILGLPGDLLARVMGFADDASACRVRETCRSIQSECRSRHAALWCALPGFADAPAYAASHLRRGTLGLADSSEQTWVAFAIAVGAVCGAHESLRAGAHVDATELRRLEAVSTALLDFLLLCRAANSALNVGHDSSRDVASGTAEWWQSLAMWHEWSAPFIECAMATSTLQRVVSVLRMRPLTHVGALAMVNPVVMPGPGEYEWIVMGVPAPPECRPVVRSTVALVRSLRKHARMINELDVCLLLPLGEPLWASGGAGEWLGTWILSARGRIRQSTLSAALGVALRALASAPLKPGARGLCAARALCIALQNGHVLQARAVMDWCAGHRYLLRWTDVIELRPDEAPHALEPMTPLAAGLLSRCSHCRRMAWKPPPSLKPLLMPTQQTLAQFLRLGRPAGAAVHGCGAFQNCVQALVERTGAPAEALLPLYEEFVATHRASLTQQTNLARCALAAANAFMLAGVDREELLAFGSGLPCFASASQLVRGQQTWPNGDPWASVADAMDRWSAVGGVTDGVQHSTDVLQLVQRHRTGSVLMSRGVAAFAGVRLPVHIPALKCCRLRDGCVECRAPPITTTKKVAAVLTLDCGAAEEPWLGGMDAAWAGLVMFASMPKTTIP